MTEAGTPNSSPVFYLLDWPAMSRGAMILTLNFKYFLSTQDTSGSVLQHSPDSVVSAGQTTEKTETIMSTEA